MKEPKLVKGDWKSLEGRVIVYAKFMVETPDVWHDSVSGLRSGDIVAEYAARSREDLLKRFSLEQTFSEPRRKEQDQGAHIFCIDYPADSEVDLSYVSEDVLFVGEHSSRAECEAQINRGLGLYFQKFYNQKPAQTNEVPDKTPHDSYRNVRPEKLLEYITREYINHMVFASGREDNKEFAQLKHRFQQFFSGSDLTADVNQLCCIIEKNQKNQDADKIEILMAKIVMKYAITKEAYEVAAQMRDKIKQLGGA